MASASSEYASFVLIVNLFACTDMDNILVATRAACLHIEYIMFDKPLFLYTKQFFNHFY